MSEMNMFMHVPLRISIEIGYKDTNVAELLKLVNGSVIQLNREAGTTVDILVNDLPIACGEVILLSGKFAVRLTDVISHEERCRRFSIPRGM